MNFKTTAMLGLLLFALAGYFYLYEYEKDDGQKAETVFDISQEAVSRFTVTTESGVTSAENIPREGWQIVDPLKYPADPAVVGALINEFANMSPVRTVVDSASDLGEFGLDSPNVTVEVSAGLSAPSILLIGDSMPTGASYYAVAKGTDRVFLITNEARSRLSKSTDEMRDRSLLHIDETKISRVVVQSDQYRKPLVCELDTLGTWRVREPFAIPAEQNEAISLANNIAGLKALEFANDDPKSLRMYGLDRPFATATVTSRDGSIDASIKLGKGQDGLYALSSEFNTVYSLTPNRLGQIVRDPELFRRKSAFDFRSFNVSKIDLQVGLELVSIVKRSFEDWRMLAPVETRADDRTITGLLDSLEVMKIQEYIPVSNTNLKKYALLQPTFQITCTIVDKPAPARIAVGTVSDDGRSAYVRDLNEDWIYRVGATGLKHIPTTSTDMRDRKVLRYKGFEVNMFEIVRGDLRVRVRRDQKQKTVWKLEEPYRSDADAVTVGRAFSALDSVYTQIFVTDEAESDLTRFGLDDPVMEITLLSGGRANVAEERHSLIVGKTFPGDESLVYVKRREGPVVSLVKNRFVTELNRMVDNTTPES